MASPTGSGQQQTKYESETSSHGLRFAYKASRIFRARRPLKLSGRLGTLPFRLAPGTKCRQISELPNRDHTRELCPRGRPRSSQGRQSLPSSGGSLPDPGRGEGTEHKWSRNRRRAAPSDSRREKQSQFASPARRSQAMVAKAFRPSAARRPDPGRGEGSGHKRSRNQRRGAPRDSWRERQSQFAPPARRTVTPKVTPTNAAASSTASRLKERCAASPRIIVPIIVSKDDLALNTLSREAGRELCRIAAPCFFGLTRFSRKTVPTL